MTTGTHRRLSITLLAVAVLAAAVTSPAMAGEIVLAWAASSDEVTVGYDVEVLDPFDQVLDVIDAGAATSVTVRDLVDDTRYRFRIRPYDATGRRAREASRPIETFPAPRIDALDGAPAPGATAVATLRGANFDPEARVVSRRSAVRVVDAVVENTGLARVTLTWDGTGASPSPADLTVVNPVRKAEPYFRAHPEVLDVDGSGTIDEDDLRQVRAAFGAGRGEPQYEARLDVNGDGVIGGEDVAPIRAWLGLTRIGEDATRRLLEGVDRF